MFHSTITTASVFSTSITWNKESQQEGELDNSSLSKVPYMLDVIAVAEIKVGRMEAF